MAEEVVVEAVPEVPAATTSGKDVLPTYDEALLDFVKGRAKQPQQPDPTERNLQVDKLQTEIKKHSERIKEIKDVIDSKRTNAKGISSGQQDIQRRLATLRDEFQQVLRQKQHIRNELEAVNKQREAFRTQLRTIREKIKVTNLETIEASIKEIEGKLNHESHSLQDENKLHQKLQALTAARPLARENAVLQQKLQESDVYRSQISQRLADCDEVLKEIKDKETAEKGALDEVRNRENSATSDVPSLHVEKKECYDIIVACRAKIDEIRADFDTKYKDYIKKDRNFRAYVRVQRNKQFEERKAEREKRDAERKAEQQEHVSQQEPYEDQLYTLDGLLTYLNKFSVAEEAKPEAKASEAALPPGLKPLKRDDGMDSLFSVAGKAKGKSKIKGEKDTKPKDRNQKLLHTFETLNTFMKMSIDVPQTTAEVPKALEAALAKKQHFKALQEEAKKNPPKRKADKADKAAEAEPEAAEAEAEPEAAAEAGEAAEVKDVGVTLTVEGADDSVSLELKVSEGDE